MEDSNIVRYDGVCPICGSQDGMVVKGKDGKYRNICRVMGCDAMYKPTPFILIRRKTPCFSRGECQNEGYSVKAFS